VLKAVIICRCIFKDAPRRNSYRWVWCNKWPAYFTCTDSILEG